MNQGRRRERRREGGGGGGGISGMRIESNGPMEMVAKWQKEKEKKERLIKESSET